MNPDFNFDEDYIAKSRFSFLKTIHSNKIEYEIE